MLITKLIYQFFNNIKTIAKLCSSTIKSVTGPQSSILNPQSLSNSVTKTSINGAILLSILLLCGCSTVDKFVSSDNTMSPSSLVSFNPTILTERLWITNVGNGSGKYYLRMTPAIAGNKIYTANYNGIVTACDRETGKIIWSISTGSMLTSGISVDNGTLFVATGNGEVIALNETNGNQVWKTQVGSEITRIGIEF